MFATDRYIIFHSDYYNSIKARKVLGNRLKCFVIKSDKRNSIQI